MALPSSGTLTMNAIRIELGIPTQSPFSLDTAENGGYVTINVCSPSRPSSGNPAAMSEWYSYNHTATCTPTPTPTPPPPTPTPTPPPPTATPTPTPTSGCLCYNLENNTGTGGDYYYTICGGSPTVENLPAFSSVQVCSSDAPYGDPNISINACGFSCVGNLDCFGCS